MKNRNFRRFGEYFNIWNTVLKQNSKYFEKNPFKKKLENNSKKNWTTIQDKNCERFKKKFRGYFKVKSEIIWNIFNGIYNQIIFEDKNREKYGWNLENQKEKLTNI